MKLKIAVLVATVLFAQLFFTFNASATGCPEGEMMDFLADWPGDEIFPLMLAGRVVKKAPDGSYEGVAAHSDNICHCKKGQYEVYGITAFYWAPTRLIETVKTPYYFPFMGECFEDIEESGFKKGSNMNASSEAPPHTFKQAHMVTFPIMMIAGVLENSLCGKIGGETYTDIGIDNMSELDATWNNDALAKQEYPEAALFASDIVQFSCVADAVVANMGFCNPIMFWCIGSSGSMYPITGRIANSKPIEASHGIAVRYLYKMAKEWKIFDKTANLCMNLPMPLLRKCSFKMSMVRPKPVKKAINVGVSSLLYGTAANPTFGSNGNPPDEFLWMLFEQNECCFL